VVTVLAAKYAAAEIVRCYRAAVLGGEISVVRRALPAAEWWPSWRMESVQ
jgi:hypothetical protein